MQCIQNWVENGLAEPAEQEKWIKGTEAHFSKMVKKMMWLALKTITWQRMIWEWVNTVSIITFTKFQGSARRK